MVNDLTDAQWEVIRPLLPSPKKRGRPADLTLYRLRWIIERTIRLAGPFPAVGGGYERSVHLYWAFLNTGIYCNLHK